MLLELAFAEVIPSPKLLWCEGLIDPVLSWHVCCRAIAEEENLSIHYGCLEELQLFCTSWENCVLDLKSVDVWENKMYRICMKIHFMNQDAERFKCFVIVVHNKIQLGFSDTIVITEIHH